ncbi:oligosaccharide flippase family protein [Acidicapsa ligni]|uniref:oligosaccharide flippase family protein n=1 Tax=Acidicapsa ligni TaxID=542300 RepID=UPI0021DF9DE2|nr:oligosaccharide flippase family protein [Acidicapsa ligni]
MSFTAKLRSVHISNATYGIADYVSLPALMLCSAPFLLHRLGVEQYAIWVLASAAVTSGILLSAGFGDAALKFIAAYRGSNDHVGVERIIRTLLGINLALGTTIAILVGLLIPFLVSHLPNVSAALRISYQRALAIGCILLVVKAVESVFICAQRAYERYDVAARFTIATRVATIGAAVAIAAFGRGTVTIMLSTLLIAIISASLQAFAVWRRLAMHSLLPSLNRASVRELFGFGAFSWIQGAVGLLTGQADRFLVGYLLGMHAIAYYSICVQAALPIHGIVAAGLQVLFPYLAARLGLLSASAMRQKFATAFAVNVVLVAALAAPVIFGSRYILRLWMGEDFSSHAYVALSITACGFALLGLNVTGFYMLMAMGRIKLLALVNVAGAAAMLAAIAILAPRFGIVGAAAGRLIYGPIICLIYIPLRKALHITQGVPTQASMQGAL